jgi:hypothetical protein
LFGLRRLGKPISPCGINGESTCKVVEIGVRVLVVGFGELAAVERGDELERFLGASPLQTRMPSRTSLASRYSPAFNVSSMKASCSRVGLTLRVGVGLISLMGPGFLSSPRPSP